MTETDDTKCFLCGAECEVIPCDGNTLSRCQYCGEYGLNRKVRFNYRDKQIERRKVACVAAERRLQGLDGYVILMEAGDEASSRPTITMESLLASYPQTATDLLDRSLLSLRRMVNHPGDLMKLDVDHPTVLFSLTKEGMIYVLSQFRQAGFIAERDFMHEGRHSFPTEHMAQSGFLIQAKGWKRIAELESGPRSDNPQAFVAMWFDRSMEDIYANGIEPAIEADCGIRCVRIDNIQHNNKICDEIIAEIRKSSFVVADFTAGCCRQCDTCKRKDDCNDQVRPRGGVYFEAGFALGLGIPVIWTVHEDQMNKVHFDTRQYNHITYKNAEDLRAKLRNRIQATLVSVTTTIGSRQTRLSNTVGER